MRVHYHLRASLAVLFALWAGPMVPAFAAPASVVGTSAIADLVDRVDGAVVSLDTVARAQRDPFFDVFGEGMGPDAMEQKGVGSGFIIDSNGLIVTNFHVVRGAQQIRVTMATGKSFAGRVVGADPANDLALVQVNAKGLPALKFISGENVRVGDWVLAIGSPLGLSHTVSVGIISALNRGIAISDRVNYIQTDAAINPGNSGGPLITMQGEVVGVNTAIASHGQGIGFAIPAWTAQNVVTQLRTKGRVERTYMGVSIRDVRGGDVSGVGIVATAPGGAARRAGLQPGDIVVAADGQPVRTTRDLFSAMNNHAVGASMTLVVVRGGKRVTVPVVLQAAPERPMR